MPDPTRTADRLTPEREAAIREWANLKVYTAANSRPLSEVHPTFRALLAEIDVLRAERDREPQRLRDAWVAGCFSYPNGDPLVAANFTPEEAMETATRLYPLAALPGVTDGTD